MSNVHKDFDKDSEYTPRTDDEFYYDIENTGVKWCEDCGTDMTWVDYAGPGHWECSNCISEYDEYDCHYCGDTGCDECQDSY